MLHHIGAVAVVAGVRRHRPAQRWPWYLIAAALVSLGVGDAAVLSTSLPELADAFWLVAYLILMVAVLRLVRARSPGRDLPALLDALVVTIGPGVVSWQFLMAPTPATRRSPWTSSSPRSCCPGRRRAAGLPRPPAQRWWPAAGGATVRRFRSGDLGHAGRLLRRPGRSPRMICMDGVNSMTGNPPDLPAFAALAREHGARL